MQADKLRGKAAKDDSSRSPLGDRFRVIIETHNRRLYRIARSIVRNDDDAEDIVQESYLRAFSSLDGFRGEASLQTWLSRIVVNEALGRLRKRKAERTTAEICSQDATIVPFPNPRDSVDPELTVAQREILAVVHRAVDQLPDEFRSVFVLRAIEGISVDETASLLDLKPETVKTRLHRARYLLRGHLEAAIGPFVLDAFPFAGERCRRLTSQVLRRLGIEEAR